MTDDPKALLPVEQCDREAAIRAANGLAHEFLIDREAYDGTVNLLSYVLARHRLARTTDRAPLIPAGEGQVHHFNCWPEVFGEMLAGRKTAEFRYDDRGYAVGDTLLIREWDPEKKAYTHREISRDVTHILRGGLGMPVGYVMLSLSPTAPPPGDDAVERVARAISQHTFALVNGKDDCGDWDEMSQAAHDVYRQAARAAVAALPSTAREEALREALKTLRDAVQDIAEAEAIPNDAVAFVWCREVARAALASAAKGEA